MFPFFKQGISHYIEKRDQPELTNLLNALLHSTKPFKDFGFIEQEDIEWLFKILEQAAWLCEIEKDQRKKKFEEDKPNLDEEDQK